VHPVSTYCTLQINVQLCSISIPHSYVLGVASTSVNSVEPQCTINKSITAIQNVLIEC